MAPWQGPRHRSWASDTNLSFAFAALIVGGYVIWEMVSVAPQGMVTLVGIAGGALFGALSGDKKKRDVETEATAQTAQRTANRAEAKADDATKRVAAEEHRHDQASDRADVAELRADRSQDRETEHSLHIEHQDDDDHGQCGDRGRA